MTDIIKELKKALEFYTKLENYMAELLPVTKEGLNRGFDFKHTPVHNDGGRIAKAALAKLEAWERGQSSYSNSSSGVYAKSVYDVSQGRNRQLTGEECLMYEPLENK